MLTTYFLLLISTTLATPIQKAAQDTPEFYYLSNCFNQSDTTIQYAEVDYYSSSSSSDASEAPDLVGSVNPTTSVDYEDGTWFVTSPFKFTVFIGDGAYTAKAGSLVGNANSSSFAGPMNCVRLTRKVLYEPSPAIECFTDYACVDSHED